MPDNIGLNRRAIVPSREIQSLRGSGVGTPGFISDPASLTDTSKVRDWYDGILFVNESTPTHPTANARKTVERKESF